MKSIWSSSESETSRNSDKFAQNPTEIALTATCIFLKKNNPLEVLICNPSPESWNSWMFPYGSQKFQVPESKNLYNMTLIEIENFIDTLDDQPENQQSVRIQKLNSMINNKSNKLVRFDTVYETKVSKSSNKLTLYTFEYYWAETFSELNPNVQFKWINIPDLSNCEQAINQISVETKLSVEKNVSSALKNLISLNLN